MKIVCNSIEDFLENLQTADAVHRKTVHYNRTSRPAGTSDRRSATSFELFYQVSAVMEFGDGTQALLEAGVNCGIDRKTADGGDDGTVEQKRLHELICDYCSAHGLKAMPGIIDV